MEVPRNLSTDFHDCVPQFSIVINTGMFFICFLLVVYVIKFSIVINTGFTGRTSGGKVSKKYLIRHYRSAKTSSHCYTEPLHTQRLVIVV